MGEMIGMLDFGFYNMDCMQGMKEFPDGFFDVAIVDPPYGGGGCEFKRTDKSRFGGNFDRYKLTRTGGTWASKYGNTIIDWDMAPTDDYFKELFRVSKNQIIWGANYFGLPPARCFIVWEKTNIPENFTMSMCEYAWTSFNDNAKIYKHTSQRDKTSGKFHPTEKPIALYEWIINNFTNDGDTILDTHVGSASSLIACHKTNHKYVGFELNPDYYSKAKQRLDNETAQMTIFDMV